jgi:hypothetical protein
MSDSQTTEIWVTLEAHPRRLIVKGRSAIDPDCLVAYLDDGTEQPLWIVQNASLTERCYVAGLDVHASMVKQDASSLLDAI